MVIPQGCVEGSSRANRNSRGVSQDRQEHEEMAGTHFIIDVPLGQIKDAGFSFKNPLIDAHFRFASYIFDRLGDVNEIFQAKYGFVHYFLEFMIPLDQVMKNELAKIGTGDFATFPFLRKLEKCQIPQFVSILKHLILNMTVRFFNVSSSLNKKNVRKFLNYDQVVIMPGAPLDGRESVGFCPFSTSSTSDHGWFPVTSQNHSPILVLGMSGPGLSPF